MKLYIENVEQEEAYNTVDEILLDAAIRARVIKTGPSAIPTLGGLLDIITEQGWKHKTELDEIADGLRGKVIEKEEALAESFKNNMQIADEHNQLVVRHQALSNTYDEISEKHKILNVKHQDVILSRHTATTSLAEAEKKITELSASIEEMTEKTSKASTQLANLRREFTNYKKKYADPEPVEEQEKEEKEEEEVWEEELIEEATQKISLRDKIRKAFKSKREVSDEV